MSIENVILIQNAIRYLFLCDIFMNNMWVCGRCVYFFFSSFVYSVAWVTFVAFDRIRLKVHVSPEWMKLDRQIGFICLISFFFSFFCVIVYFREAENNKHFSKKNFEIWSNNVEPSKWISVWLKFPREWFLLTLSLSLSQIPHSTMSTVECAANILIAKLQFYSVQSARFSLIMSVHRNIKFWFCYFHQTEYSM